MPGKIALLTLDSAARLGSRVDQILSEWRGGGHFSIPVECPRFSSGEAKCIIRESVRDMQEGLLVPSRNAQAIKESLLKLIQNESFRLNLARNAQKRFRTFFTREIQMNKLAAWLRSTPGTTAG